MRLPPGGIIKRSLVLVYGLFCYLTFIGALAYTAGFLGQSFFSGVSDQVQEFYLPAAIFDVFLLLVFAGQHSIMARPTFKRWWRRYVPAAIERSTYVCASSLTLCCIFYLWQPLNGLVLWDLRAGPAELLIFAVFICGWLALIVSTMLIDHLDLFGIKQVLLYARGRRWRNPDFKMSGFYRYVRHPIYLSWLAIFWATPLMTPGHLILAVGITVYILVAIQLEERNLIELHGEQYVSYIFTVPMLIPLKGRATGQVAPLWDEGVEPSVDGCSTP